LIVPFSHDASAFGLQRGRSVRESGDIYIEELFMGETLNRDQQTLVPQDPTFL
jgi:hypothetical protein